MSSNQECKWWAFLSLAIWFPLSPKLQNGERSDDGRRVKVYKKNCIKSEDGQSKKKVGFSKCIGNFLVGDTSWRRKQKFRWKQKIFSFCKEAVVMHFWSFSLVWVVHWMHEEKQQPNGDCCKNFKSEKDWTDLMLRHYPKWLLHTYLQNENGSAEGKLLLARLRFASTAPRAT